MSCSRSERRPLCIRIMGVALVWASACILVASEGGEGRAPAGDGTAGPGLGDLRIAVECAESDRDIAQGAVDRLAAVGAHVVWSAGAKSEAPAALERRGGGSGRNGAGRHRGLVRWRAHGQDALRARGAGSGADRAGVPAGRGGADHRVGGRAGERALGGSHEPACADGKTRPIASRRRCTRRRPNSGRALSPWLVIRLAGKATDPCRRCSSAVVGTKVAGSGRMHFRVNGETPRPDRPRVSKRRIRDRSITEQR